MDARDIIIRPWITEKSTALMQDRKYTFEVHPDANKVQIKKAVEEIFKVKVLKVNTMRVPGKLRRVGRFVGRKPDRKKAIVTLAEGQSIPIFEGV
ncbi:50S ribosomal protein L23 [Caldinitratiruptor microaerophilus]|uniref:Large ribosomal subunit protein uL23 n=1 Tax=Caldinitratiruptor microaerophilus TaxID=671077 RepID=A0AA35CN31_9FIRM|nr:50S ribosomal protein L23 [Caldinitratiruptor microaerophilus]BDG62222.1 50S ribosomal protein L23 [Caldinitratiruptor microaerophilus]